MEDILQGFNVAYDLKTNCAKSRALFSKGAPCGKIKKLTSLSSIISTNSHDKYLGFAMVPGKVKREHLSSIVDRLNSINIMKKKVIL